MSEGRWGEGGELVSVEIRCKSKVKGRLEYNRGETATLGFGGGNLLGSGDFVRLSIFVYFSSPHLTTGDWPVWSFTPIPWAGPPA